MRTTKQRRPRRRAPRRKKESEAFLEVKWKKYFQGEWRIRHGSSQMRTDRWPPDLETWRLVTPTGCLSGVEVAKAWLEPPMQLWLLEEMTNSKSQPDPGIEPGSPALLADSLPTEPQRKPRVALSQHISADGSLLWFSQSKAICLMHLKHHWNRFVY